MKCKEQEDLTCVLAGRTRCACIRSMWCLGCRRSLFTGSIFGAGSLSCALGSDLVLRERGLDNGLVSGSTPMSKRAVDLVIEVASHSVRTKCFLAENTGLRYSKLSHVLMRLPLNHVFLLRRGSEVSSLSVDIWDHYRRALADWQRSFQSKAALRGYEQMYGKKTERYVFCRNVRRLSKHPI